MKLFALPTALALTAALPSLVTAGLFPSKGKVKMLNEPDFRKVLKQEKTSIVAFTAPWCGHCKNLAPEYIRAAESMSPLVAFYAVDCDDEANKRLCGEQGIQGFPTIKSFPRGGKGAAHTYNDERKAKKLAQWAESEIPLRVTSLKGKEAAEKWVEKERNLPRALLLTAQSRVPPLWKTLGNEFNKKIAFGAARDESGEISESFGVESGASDGKGKILIWKAGREDMVVYDGKLNYKALVEHFGDLVSGKPKDEL
ncbi:hypothetical protein BOTBODRAFT_126348 [Botryobasidium botryosum FD-172 SS1]|uniref:Thioredoxin domain-containing protein n=1 Tax=Botryobasidium botryosum (strain FD-172 SS1) TaxID=930990 RepID=A0A067MXQ5_BOTB1|nr:hypothetical protein BOTBODRAFT_126348 [Botryobasidium botryosum FD-172 SS1]